ncbi:MAG: hypothetical protein H0X12_04750 [Nocardioides sp.]|nr:hypothetical protein [Nocardioides sp.]
MRTRLALIGLGTLVGVYGAWLLLSRQDFDQLRSVAVWLVAGVLLHDVLLSGVLIALGLVGSRLLPMSLRRPATIALIVIGTVTVAAVPVLGRFGARADNATLLDRNYVVGWLVFAVLVLVVLVLPWFRGSFRSHLNQRREKG